MPSKISRAASKAVKPPAKKAAARVPAKKAPAKKAPTKKAPAKKKIVKPLTPWAKWLAGPGDPIDALCDAIASGESLNAYCATTGIRYATMRDWISDNKDRASKYACAREDRADKLADEIVGISDEIEVLNVLGEDGQVVEVKMDATAVARNRLRVDARKWVASKLKPRVYADRTTVQGADDAPPVQMAITGELAVTPSEAYLRMLGKR